MFPNIDFTHKEDLTRLAVDSGIRKPPTLALLLRVSQLIFQPWPALRVMIWGLFGLQKARHGLPEQKFVAKCCFHTQRRPHRAGLRFRRQEASDIGASVESQPADFSALASPQSHDLGIVWALKGRARTSTGNDCSQTLISHTKKTSQGWLSILGSGSLRHWRFC